MHRHHLNRGSVRLDPVQVRVLVPGITHAATFERRNQCRQGQRPGRSLASQFVTRLSPVGDPSVRIGLHRLARQKPGIMKDRLEERWPSSFTAHARPRGKQLLSPCTSHDPWGVNPVGGCFADLFASHKKAGQHRLASRLTAHCSDTVKRLQKSKKMRRLLTLIEPFLLVMAAWNAHASEGAHHMSIFRQLPVQDADIPEIQPAADAANAIDLLGQQYSRVPAKIQDLVAHERQPSVKGFVRRQSEFIHSFSRRGNLFNDFR